ncbi:hypothetical protein EJ110_NYTH28019 [Nymphaea thermarum]|nr:hypothetical protein EJ110_NYTH28019 [Nymphaea thermarum]
MEKLCCLFSFRDYATEFQLQDIRKGSMSIAEYITKAKNIVHQIIAAGKAVSHDDLVMQILKGLPNEYFPFGSNDCICDSSIHGPMLEIICKVMEVLLKEVHGTEKYCRKDCTKTKDVRLVGTARKPLRVYALEYVCRRRKQWRWKRDDGNFSSNGLICDSRIHSPMLEIICKVMEVLLKEVHGSKKDWCKDCTNTEDVKPVGKAKQHLRVHALVHVCAKDGSDGGSVRDAGIFMQEKLGTSVVACEYWAHGNACWAFSLSFHEEEPVHYIPSPFRLTVTTMELTAGRRTPRTW